MKIRTRFHAHRNQTTGINISLSVWRVHLNENIRKASSFLPGSWGNKTQQNPNAFDMIYSLWRV